MSKKVEKNEIMNVPEAMEVLAENKKDYQRLCRSLATATKSIENNILKVSRDLFEVHERRLYEIDSYKNIYEFAKAKYGISRGTCSNYLGLCSYFGIDSKYNYSQMFAMLPYLRKGGKADEFNPDMSSAEIKKEVKNLLAKSQEKKEEKSVEIDPSTFTHAEILLGFSSKAEYDKLIDELDFIICNAFAKADGPIRLELICNS